MTKKKKTFDLSLKEHQELAAFAHTQIMLELRKSNMAFTELLSKVKDEDIRDSFYQLHEFKLKDTNVKLNQKGS